MAEEYLPPLSPDIVFSFPGGADYSPPLSPNITWTFGLNTVTEVDGYLKTNYMILLTM